MRDRVTAATLAALVVASALTAAVAAGPAVAAAPAEAPAAPEDPERDVLGWEDGYWYNESIDVDQSDGLNDRELDAVVSRAMARVEIIRKLEFEQSVPVNIISRETFRERSGGGTGEIPVNASIHQNVKFEALFFVGENQSAIATQQSNQGASVLGYYSPARGEIVIVSENTETPQMDEITLSQELFHALQDQHFDLRKFNQSTRELHNAVDGIVEGDGNYVDYLYQQRCDSGEWSCVMPDGNGSGGSTPPGFNYGMYFLTYQPYSDGPPFVQQIYEEGGWEAVNEVYQNPPASTEQVIHPEKYGEDQPARVRIEDRSSDEWTVPDLGPRSIDYAEFGEAGLFTMLYMPSYETRSEVIIPPQAFFNRQSNLDPLHYESPPSAGWDGDKLLPYMTSESAETNETGYVYKTVWDSQRDAGEFASAYRELLTYRNAEQVGADTYRIPSGPYADAFHLLVNGSTVTIVNAPTVDELAAVNAAVSVEAANATTGTDGGTTGAGNGTGATTTANATTTAVNGQPGFGPVPALAALLAVLAAALVAGRRVR